MKVKKCRICGSKNLKLIFSLGRQAPANNLLSAPKEKIKSYPLTTVQCQHCGLIQLNYVVPKEELFDNYFYIPSASKTYLSHFDNLSKSLVSDLNLKKGNLVVDIGGSDGSLLKFFEKRGMKVLNVEPAKNIKSKVKKINKYFDQKTARLIVRRYGKAKLATATNVFAHIDDLSKFLKSLNIILETNGVFFAQFPDVRNLLKENQFDTIYHEHLSYFTYEPLHHLFMNSPFELFRIDNSTIHGGSMRIYVRRRGDLLGNFIKNVRTIDKKLNKFLRSEKKKGKKIAAFGAAAKGITLLSYFKLDNKIIDYIADATPYKQGKYSPETLIQVKPEEELIKNPPDIILILAWNYKEEIIGKVTKMLKGRKITFVIPIPKVEIIKA